MLEKEKKEEEEDEEKEEKEEEEKEEGAHRRNGDDRKAWVKKKKRSQKKKSEKTLPHTPPNQDDPRPQPSGRPHSLINPSVILDPILFSPAKKLYTLISTHNSFGCSRLSKYKSF